MSKQVLLKSAVLLCVLSMFSVLMVSPARAALQFEDVTTWYWVGPTAINSVVVGDVDADGSAEIVTGGYHYDNTRYRAQLCVWDGSTVSLENVKTWYWIDSTAIYSIAVGDVDGDGSVEIVTGGTYDDGTWLNAQLCVWSGSTLALEGVTTWRWTGDTRIVSVAIGDVDGDAAVEIVTGGSFADDVQSYAQLCVWSGANLALENVKTWYWTGNTVVSSVTVDDVDADDSMEMVTGGLHYDGMRTNAQLCVWSGSTLELEDVTTWYWTDSTGINSAAVGDVDTDGSVEIVTCGPCDSFYAQLCVWSGSDLALEGVTTWIWTGYTFVYSVTVSDVDADESAEILTGGYHFDGVCYNAQLCVWSGSTLAVEDVTTWYWVSSTCILSVAVGNVDADNSVEIVTGGYFYDSIRFHAQLCVWSA